MSPANRKITTAAKAAMSPEAGGTSVAEHVYVNERFPLEAR